ncbi:PKD domain-containing protein [Ekhidna sp.]|uniref:PKD domain-containing protein n=1 Tax=Ekhidna sp. TaxID=2608089 RepID=UPI003CCC0A8E
MKNSKIFKSLFTWTALGCMVALTSCFDEDDVPAIEDPIASFQFEVSEENFDEVSFTNFSVNADSYSWTFGDGATSTEENPTHTYSETGTFTVTLVASNEAGATSEFSDDVTITDPLEAQRALIGSDGKTWLLLGDNSTGINPIQVGPQDRSQVWFAIADLCVRECIFDDTWTFNTDGTYTFDNNGDFWGEEGVWAEGIAGTCFDATNSANFVGLDGQDLSGWNSGTHEFVYDPSSETLTINGGFIGLTKAGTDAEITEPAASVTYSVVKLVDVENGVDTLVLETNLAEANGYWGFTLVSYDNEADKVVVGECEETEKTIIDVVDIDFEASAPDFGAFGGNDDAGGGMVVERIANPDASGINTSDFVGSVAEPEGSRFYSGISTTLDGYIDFSTKQTFKVKVWSPVAGATIKFKLEDSTDPNINKEIDATITNADTWEELTYTFEAADSEKFDVVVLFFDFDPNGDQSNKADARTHYFDDIILE